MILDVLLKPRFDASATGSGQTETQGNVQSVEGKAQVAAGKPVD